MADIGGGGQARGQEGLVIVPVPGHHLQLKINLAGQHVAFPDLRPVADHGLEGFQVMFRLAAEADIGENRDVEAKRLGLQVGMVAPDIARFLQGADPAQAGRRGNTGQLGQFDVGYAPVGLEIVQDSPVDAIQLYLLRVIFIHGHPPFAQ